MVRFALYNQEQLSLFGNCDPSPENPEYDAFVEKFKPKKATDDCYTPPEIFDVVKKWACSKYGIDPACIVRPFYPGGDYKRFDYPPGSVVLDNPPFSILSQILEFYLHRGIPFFLFAPSLTVFSGSGSVMKVNHIVCDADITYENGAVVRTAFVTSYGGGVVAQTAPDLGRAIEECSAKLNPKKSIPRYAYPPQVLTSAMLQRLSRCGVEFSARSSDCVHIRSLDAQKPFGKAIYGTGLLLSESAAADKAVAEGLARMSEQRMAEKQKPKVWDLSDRERRLVASLGKDQESLTDSVEEDADAITFWGGVQDD